MGLDAFYKQWQTQWEAQADKRTPPWRQAAWQHFLKQGIPTRKSETYRYTPVAKWLKGLADVPPLSAALPQIVPPCGDNDAKLITITDQGNPLATQQGTHFTFSPLDLAQLANGYGKQAKPEKDAFVALNTALATQPYHLAIHQSSTQPIWLMHPMGSHIPSASHHPRIYITVAPHTEVHLVQYHAIQGKYARFTNGVTEIRLGQGAKLHYYSFHTQSNPGCDLQHTYIHQQAGSRLQAHTYALGATKLHQHLQVTLDGESSKANLYGLYAVKDRGHVTQQVVVNHQKPDTHSTTYYKGIADGKATGAFHGHVYVAPDAQRISADQQNKNWLLSPNAKLYTRPQLKIWADDVQCTHGATIAPPPSEQLFYLQSRGLTLANARHLLLAAFAGEVIHNIGLPSYRAYLNKALQVHMLSADV